MPSIIKVDQIQSDTGRVNLASSITYNGVDATFAGSTDDYRGIQPASTAINLKLGTGSGAEPRVYLHGTGNGQSSAGNLFLGTGNNQGSVNVGGLLNLVSSSAAGIKFPGTQVASSDPNTLDDYEEGTFTPILGADAGGTFTQTVQYGRYVKIGQVVHFNIYIVWSAYSGSGSAQLSNFPFSIDWGTARQRAQAFPVTASSASATQGYIFKNDTNGLVNNSYLYNFTDTSIISASSLGASGWISVRGTYFTS